MSKRSKQSEDQFPRFAWMSKVRLGTFVFVVGVPLALIGWGAIPLVWVPAVVAAAGVTFTKLTSRLSKATCWTCGQDLSSQEPSPHGLVCPSCGSLNQQMPMAPLLLEDLDSDDAGTQDA